MKKAGILAAASAAAASSSVVLSGYECRPVSHNEGSSSASGKKAAGAGSGRDEGGDKFAPRFDGLRFIETLVTAHR
ncbi:hypothetical protein KSP39_PZI022725 [Platanthera zijinensis]|uniref:Uncharacterized protein n=1 Tax=Platanthera zijinensis TaxID=2320716 RepID=A0AAP0FVF0_9ASPA